MREQNSRGSAPSYYRRVAISCTTLADAENNAPLETGNALSTQATRAAQLIIDTIVDGLATDLGDSQGATALPGLVAGCRRWSSPPWYVAWALRLCPP